MNIDKPEPFTTDEELQNISEGWHYAEVEGVKKLFKTNDSPFKTDEEAWKYIGERAMWATNTKNFKESRHFKALVLLRKESSEEYKKVSHFIAPLLPDEQVYPYLQTMTITNLHVKRGINILEISTKVDDYLAMYKILKEVISKVVPMLKENLEKRATVGCNCNTCTEIRKYLEEVKKEELKIRSS